MVQEGDLVLVLEAMKMEQPITAHRAGRISSGLGQSRRHHLLWHKLLEIAD
jgi:biotin carboxyl carrier protein